MSEETQGFKINDRRAFDTEGQERDNQADSGRDAAQAARDQRPQETPPAAGDSSPPAGEAPRRSGKMPLVDFSGLILSLAHAAVVHLGQVPGPDGQPGQADFPLARHTIDTIAMLKEKTRGNLDPEEQVLLDNALTELRLAFVRLGGK